MAKLVSTKMTDKEIEEIDSMVSEGYSRSRADFLRKAALEYIRSQNVAARTRPNKNKQRATCKQTKKK